MKSLSFFLATIAAVYGILDGKDWKKLSKLRKSFVLIAVLSSIIAGVNGFLEWQKDDKIEKIEESYGQLIPENATKATVQWGDGGMMTIETSTGAFVDNGGNYFFRLYSLNGKLFFSSVIRDLNGKVVAAVYDNDWTMYNKADYEYNNDDKGFEIVTNGDRQVLFQIDYRNNIADIQGLFVNDKGIGFYWYGYNNGHGDIGFFAATSNYYKDSGYNYPVNKLIFKYPRGMYLSNRNP